MTEPAKPKVPWDDAHPRPRPPQPRHRHWRPARRHHPHRRNANPGAATTCAGSKRQHSPPDRGARENLATPRQVNYILDLLAQRDRDGDASRVLHGPTDEAGVEQLTRSEASTYIDSLKGDY